MGHWTEFQPILGRDIRAKEGVVPFVLNKPVAGKILIDKITGASYQKQLSGKNLYNVNDVDTPTHDPQVDSDGWITFEFDNSSGQGTIWGNYFTTVPDNLKPSTEYTIVVETEEFPDGSGGAITVWGNTANDLSVFPDSHVITSGGTTIIKKTTKDDLSNVNYFLRTFVSFPAYSKVKFKFRISVLEDTSVTADTFVYEPYCGGMPSPNPDFPQGIVGLGDSWFDGIWLQGAYSSTNGVYDSANKYVICTKNKIPCKEGDVIKIDFKKENCVSQVRYWNNGKYVSGVGNRESYTVPSGVTEFAVLIQNTVSPTITPSTMSEVLVTINGTGRLRLKALGKNLLDITLDSATKNGLEFKIDKKAGTVTVNGTAEATTYFPIRTYYPWELGTYMLTGCPGKQSSATYNLAAYVGSRWNPEYGDGRIISITESKNIEYIDRVEIVVQKGQTLNNVVFKPMLRKCDSNGNPIGDDEFVPYIEGYSVEVPVYEPLRAINDVRDDICIRDGKYGVLRRVGVQNVTRLTCKWTDSSLPTTNKCMEFYTTEFTNRRADANKKDYIRSEKFMYIDGNSGELSREHCYFNASTENYKFAYFIISLDKLSFSSQTQANLTAAATAWLAENPISVQYELAEPVFEPFADQSPFYEFGTFEGFTRIDIHGKNPNLGPSTVRVSYPVNSDGVYVMDAYICGKKNEIEASKVVIDETVLHIMRKEINTTATPSGTIIDVDEYLPENAHCMNIMFPDGLLENITVSVGESGFVLVSSMAISIELRFDIFYVVRNN